MVICVQFSHFGELLKEFRISNNMTLEDLASGICSVRQLSRIEKGDNDPSLYVIHNLSKKLNIDLQEYYRIYFTSKSFIAHKLKSKLEKLIANSQMYKLRALVSEIENMDEFKEGENLQYILYSKALCSSHIDNNYYLSNKYCIKALKIEDTSFNIDLINTKIYSNIGLTTLNLLASNYNKLGEKEESLEIIQSIFKVLDNHIFDNIFTMYRSLDFEKKLYQSTSYNLSVLFMNKSDYKKALEYVERGITFSIDKNYMRFLPELLAQKSRLLLKMGLEEKAYNSFKDALSFYRICRENNDIKNLEKEIQGLSYNDKQ